MGLFLPVVPSIDPTSKMEPFVQPKFQLVVSPVTDGRTRPEVQDLVAIQGYTLQDCEQQGQRG